MIRNVIAVRKHLNDWKIEPTPNCIFFHGIDSVLQSFLHCPKTNYFIKQLEVIFKNLYVKKFKLNECGMMFGIKYKAGNYASNLGMFFWM